ncbi:phospholipase C, phosphocholine-specific [Dyella jejuensis]|uniref:phospholipase C n=1 Tax=Dyella jejuensis TaxID=1432009 RepID=A0ABW8JKU0_9GAMM
MSEIDDIKRRRFLKLTAGAAGGLTAMSMLPPAIRQALATPAATESGTIADVKHVVIFMQENRSFDHYYGSRPGVRGFNDPVPHPLPSTALTGQSVWYQPYTGNAAGYMLPFHLDTTKTSATCVNASSMGFTTDTAINNGGKFNAWNTARSAGMGMGFYNRSDLPFYYALADSFTICDQYFCSTLTDTNPNRLFLFTGSNGLSAGDSPVLDDTESSSGWTWSTYAERLQSAGISWKVYQQTDNFDDNALAWFANFKNAKSSSALYKNGMATVSSIVTAFQDDVTNNTLPQVSWIVAPAAQSEHPNYQPPDGENLSAQLIAALASNPGVYASTVFFLNYDENGGFFDHVPPPCPPSGILGGKSTVSTAGELTTVNESGDTITSSPIGLGYRVPMIIISPWTFGGRVCSQVFDHTSVLQFLEQWTGVSETNISAWRRAVCGDLTSAFDFSGSNTSWPSLPSTANYVSQSSTECSDLPAPTVPSTQAMPSAEAGTYPACALPYALDAQGSINTSANQFDIDFINSGTVGAVFQVYALNRSSSTGPWTYTVGAGSSVSDYWNGSVFNSGIYALEAHGPNGFVRHWQGSAEAAAVMPETQIVYNPAGNSVQLKMTNAGSSTCTMTVSNGYDTEDVRIYSVPAGGSVSDTWELGSTANWYDLKATVAEVSNWSRRLCGHMENGLPSTTEPPH